MSCCPYKRSSNSSSSQEYVHWNEIGNRRATVRWCLLCVRTTNMIIARRCLKHEKVEKGPHSTDNQEACLTEWSNSLQWRIDSWVKLQQLFLPMVTADRAKRQTDVDTVVPLEWFELMLPSKVVETLPCDHVTLRIEWWLRLAQVHDALNSLRSSLCAWSFVWKFKDKNLCGQGTNTRAQNTLKGIKVHINRAANKYNEAHHTLSILSSPLNETSWASVLCPLQVQDIRGMSDLLWGETEGTQKLSWIWSTHGSADDTTDETGAIEGKWISPQKAALLISGQISLLNGARRQHALIAGLKRLTYSSRRWEEQQCFSTGRWLAGRGGQWSLLQMIPASSKGFLHMHFDRPRSDVHLLQVAILPGQIPSRRWHGVSLQVLLDLLSVVDYLQHF